MSRLWPWIVGLIAVLAIWVDIPKHQFSFPFNCPGICFRLPGGASGFQTEIKTHLGLDLQGGTQLVLQLRVFFFSDLAPALTRALEYFFPQKGIVGVPLPSRNRKIGKRRPHPLQTEITLGGDPLALR